MKDSFHYRGYSILMKKIRKKNKQFGFSLIEVMVVLVIAGIMMTVAVPSLQKMVAKNRAVAVLNTFVAANSYARSQAIKENILVTLCTTTDGQSCSGSNNWQTGWIIFRNPNRVPTSAVLPADILKVYSDLTDTGYTLIGQPGIGSTISYNNAGFPQLIGGGFQAGTIEYRAVENGTTIPLSNPRSVQRDIVLSRTGRMRVIHL